MANWSSHETKVDPIKIVNLVKQESHIQSEGATVLRVQHELSNFEDRIEFAHQLLDRLAPQVTEAA